MKILSVILSLIFFIFAHPVLGMSYSDVSRNMILKLQKGQEIEAELESLRLSTVADLQAELDTDLKKIAFWVNVYNAYIQVILRKNPELYENRLSFFGKERFIIAGKSLSFGDIEHGIIRGGKSLAGFGYLPMIFQGKFIRKLKVKKTDYRVHFALNCGAISCPPVLALDANNVEKQLNALTSTYIKKHSQYKTEKNTVCVPKLLQWFSGDWGNKKAKRSFLRDNQIIPDSSKPKIEYNDYDWSLNLDNFTQNHS